MADEELKDKTEDLEDEEGAEEESGEDEGKTVKVTMLITVDNGTVLEALQGIIFEDIIGAGDIISVDSFEVEEVKS